MFKFLNMNFFFKYFDIMLQDKKIIKKFKYNFQN